MPAGFKRLCHFDPVNFDTPNAMYPVLTTRSSPMAYDPQTKYFYVAGSPGWPLWIKRMRTRISSARHPRSGHEDVRHPGGDRQPNRQDRLAEATRPMRSRTRSGVTTTAGGLLFHGEPDGNLQALDAKTGDLLWQFQTGANESGPAAVYEMDGEEYVAVLAAKSLWAFKLGGTCRQLPAPPAPPIETTFAGRVVSADAIAISGMVR